MHLKSIRLIHFRKFDEGKDNIVEFVCPHRQKQAEKDEAIDEDERIASATTLLIGKNNVGKSTVIEALQLLAGQQRARSASDFNYHYLQRLIKAGFCGEDNVPYFEIIATMHIDNNVDMTSTLTELMSIGDVVNQTSDVSLSLRCSIKDGANFLAKARRIVEDTADSEGSCLQDIIELLDEQDFATTVLDSTGKPVQSLKLNKLFNFTFVPAHNMNGPSCLSDTLNRIMKYHADVLTADPKRALEIKQHIAKLNDNLTECIQVVQADTINQVLENEVLGTSIKADIHADVTIDKILRNLIGYSYNEGGLLIPECQFGLGYTRLLLVIAHLLDYADRCDDRRGTTQVNMVAIEEPETHMHPQMQELFIQYIDKVLDRLLDTYRKRINCQLVITTHSDHIVHSKLHSGGTFDCINYLKSCDLSSEVIPLKDTSVIANASRKAELGFLKKHLRLSTQSVFFADAVILAEGQAELTLLPHFLSENESLSKYYIATIGVNGSHAKVYEELLRLLGLPTAIITDLDINRTEEEVRKFSQIKNLNGKTTTNPTLAHFAESYELSDQMIEGVRNKGNIGIFTQTKCEGYYPTSFEEALILQNADNALLRDAMLRLKPKIFKDLASSPTAATQLRENSYRYYRQLCDSKSNFAIELIYKLAEYQKDGEEATLLIPEYIQAAFAKLGKLLGGESDA